MMNVLNKDMIFGVLRSLGVLLMGFFVGKGYLTSDQASALVNAVAETGPTLIAAGLVIYGAWKKRDAAKVQQAGKVDGATVIIDPDKAAKDVVNAGEAAPNSEIIVTPVHSN